MYTVYGPELFGSSESGMLIFRPDSALFHRPTTLHYLVSVTIFQIQELTIYLRSNVGYLLGKLEYLKF